MGVDIAKAALAAGHSRRRHRPRRRQGHRRDRRAREPAGPLPGHHRRRSRRSGREAAVERFGRIDVLVNNAGNFYAGYFEEISPAQFRAQMETNFFGPLNVTRAILPVMRKQRSGHVITITSAAGIIGQEFCAAYAASKFALEGWMESLQYDLAARTGSTPPSSSPGSSAPSCSSRAPPRSGPNCPSRTTPTAPRRPSPRGRA